MTQLSREQLIEELERRIAVTTQYPGVEEAKLDAKIFKFALAALAAEAQEPVAWIVHTRGGDQLTQDGDYVASAEGIGGIHCTPLYAAPQPVAVPDVLICDMCGHDARHQGGRTYQCVEGHRFEVRAPKTEPVSQPYTLPQWIPCSEKMPEETGRYWCYVEEQNDLGKSHYQWNCSWNGNRWWVESENGGRVTHWQPLPSAPQEPTK